MVSCRVKGLCDKTLTGYAYHFQAICKHQDGDKDIDSLSNGDSMTMIEAVLMKAQVKKIIVFTDHIEVGFKCGVRMQQEYINKRWARGTGKLIRHRGRFCIIL